MRLDLNRGVTKRTGPGGMCVAMYKDKPGIFIDVNENPVSAALASQAGFDTEALLRERKRLAQLKAATDRVNAQFVEATDDIDRVVNAEGHAIKHVGGGRYAIFDASEERLTNKPMTKDEAIEMLQAMELEGDAASTENDAAEAEAAEAAAAAKDAGLAKS